MIGRRGRGDAPLLIDGDSLITRVSRPFTFLAGHHLRSTPCLVCHRQIGADQARLVTITPMSGSPSRAGGVDSTAWLVHARHSRRDGHWYALAAIARMEGITPMKGRTP